MNAFIIKYLQAEIKSNSWLFFKAIMLLVPILSIVGMFATAQMVRSINQNSFLKNSGYEWIVYFNDKPTEPAYFRVIDNATVAHIFSTDGGIFFRPQRSIEVFLAEDLDPRSWENSYFNHKNVLGGALDHLAAVDGSIGLALDFNTAKTLHKKIGDRADFIFENEQQETVHYPVTIQAILKPYRTEWGGLGLARIDSTFLNFMSEHGLDYCFARFGEGEQNFLLPSRVVYKKNQLAASMPILSQQNMVNLIIAAMGAIVVYLLINREVNFSINRRMRTIGILSALGATIKTIYTTFWVEHTLKIIISALASGIIYKYLLMERFLGEYIGLKMWLILVLIYIFIGLSSLRIGMRKIGAALRDSSVNNVISKKPEGL